MNKSSAAQRWGTIDGELPYIYICAPPFPSPSPVPPPLGNAPWKIELSPSKRMRQ